LHNVGVANSLRNAKGVQWGRAWREKKYQALQKILTSCSGVTSTV